MSDSCYHIRAKRYDISQNLKETCSSDKYFSRWAGHIKITTLQAPYSLHKNLQHLGPEIIACPLKDNQDIKDLLEKIAVIYHKCFQNV